MITGTFIDEISHDVPSANWGPEEWTRDFTAMRADGIETVVLARAGHRDRATFDSRVLRKRHAHLIVQEDLVALFLGLAEQNEMDLWFGAYESGEPDETKRDAEIQFAFADEAWERYGRSRAFRGWYVERDLERGGAIESFAALSKHLRQLAALPIVVAPRQRLSGSNDRPFALAEHRREREELVARLAGVADVVVFHDGGVPFASLPDVFELNAALARKHGLLSWARVETFDRDVVSRYAPIAWPKLRFTMESALAARVDKLVTFEYSHFLSPNSMFNSAHALHKRYREWLATQK